MKKIALILSGMLLMTGFAASAETDDAPATVQRVSAFYDLNTFYPKDADNHYYNGFGVGYNVDFRISNSLPFYVGTGLDVRFVFHENKILDDPDYNAIELKDKRTLINLNLPVNLSYRVPVADNFYLTPYLGLDFRVQVYGNSNLDVTLPEGMTDNPQYKIGDRDLFSEDDMGDAKLRRFQMGWHAGLNFQVSSFNIGLQYGTDFVKIHKNVGGSNFLVSLGYCF